MAHQWPPFLPRLCWCRHCTWGPQSLPLPLSLSLKFEHVKIPQPWLRNAWQGIYTFLGIRGGLVWKGWACSGIQKRKHTHTQSSKMDHNLGFIHHHLQKVTILQLLGITKKPTGFVSNIGRHPPFRPMFFFFQFIIMFPRAHCPSMGARHFQANAHIKLLIISIPVNPYWCQIDVSMYPGLSPFLWWTSIHSHIFSWITIPT